MVIPETCGVEDGSGYCLHRVIRTTAFKDAQEREICRARGEKYFAPDTELSGFIRFEENYPPTDHYA